MGCGKICRQMFWKPVTWKTYIYDIKIHIQEMSCKGRNCSHVAQNRVRRTVLMLQALNVEFYYRKVGITSHIAVVFSAGIQLVRETY